jgi:hypothetical protein
MGPDRNQGPLVLDGVYRCPTARTEPFWAMLAALAQSLPRDQALRASPQTMIGPAADRTPVGRRPAE